MYYILFELIHKRIEKPFKDLHFKKLRTKIVDLRETGTG